MSEPFLGEVRLMSFNFNPRGWALCNGQFLPINQNQALFSLLGTTYGGNGQTTFALPDLRGKTPIHTSNGHPLGETAGATTTTLTIAQLPTHIHVVSASTVPGNAPTATGNVLASPLNLSYRSPDALVGLAPATISSYGGSQPHTNVQPYLTLSFCIALSGIFPSQN